MTLVFFALFGFIFLITQYFQFLRDYGALETGVRLLPVAISTGIASVVGTVLAVRIGTKAVVATGLLCAGTMFIWTSNVDLATSYFEIAAQMVLFGIGMGFTTAPATESIMGAVPEANAGVGSGVNDTARELGGTLGVAVIGSVFASLYAAGFDGAPSVIPAGGGLDRGRAGGRRAGRGRSGRRTGAARHQRLPRWPAGGLPRGRGRLPGRRPRRGGPAPGPARRRAGPA